MARGSSPSNHVIRQELRDRLQAALAKLSPNDREILVMRNLEQMPAAEIAAVLGIKEGTVRVRHLRALERLRALLDLEDERRRNSDAIGVAGSDTSANPRPRGIPPSPSWSNATWPASRRARRLMRVCSRPSIPSTPSGWSACCRPWS